MADINTQYAYWDRVAEEKSFTHNLDLPLVKKFLHPESRILDFGCGYGRTCHQLRIAGYRNVLGVDSSAEMIRRGKREHPDLALEAIPPSGWSIPEKAFDLILLITVLTCIPEDEAQVRLLSDAKAGLRSGGYIYISDYLLQADERNQKRYAQYAGEFGKFGVFRLPEGVVVRHHDPEWLKRLTSGFEKLDRTFFDISTMNGNPSRAFRYFGRKRE